MARSALAQKTLSVIQVLLVEDSASDAFVIESLLEEGTVSAYKTQCVKTQSEAMDLLTSQRFDVCLLDLTLPDASGFSALIDIQDKAPDMPVLILTGINDMMLAKRAVGRGAQDYLLKDEMEVTGLFRAIDYAIERKRVEKELFQRANYDALTGLSNRESFVSRISMALARAERSAMHVAILFIDLDRFKPINDNHGHDAGDVALKIVAQRIKSALRNYDTPARLGGDEFAVLLEGLQSPRDAAAIAQKILSELANPIPYQRHTLCLGASIGIVFSDAEATPELLLQHADTAMYHAKKEGGQGYRFYADSMHDEVLERLRMEESLRIALETNEFRLLYQPYVQTDGKTVMGVEALLHWAHPGRGVLAAHEFLPAAEAARLMPQIGNWTCNRLKQDLAFWNTNAMAPLTIALNLSTTQLDAPEVLEWFTPIAKKEVLNPHSLVVEIPEEALTSMTPERSTVITKLHAMNIGLHLDHFGCSSLPLTTLTSLPFSMLKIHKSHVQKLSKDVASDMLIGAAVILAHHLGIKAGAVGVEEQWQASMLKALSCDVLQGYLTTKPLTAQQLVEWFKNRVG